MLKQSTVSVFQFLWIPFLSAALASFFRRSKWIWVQTKSRKASTDPLFFNNTTCYSLQASKAAKTKKERVFFCQWGLNTSLSDYNSFRLLRTECSEFVLLRLLCTSVIKYYIIFHSFTTISFLSILFAQMKNPSFNNKFFVEKIIFFIQITY